MANSVCIRRYLHIRKIPSAGRAQSYSYFYLFKRDRKTEKKKWIEWGRQMTVVDFVYNIITFYTGSLGRWRSLSSSSWRRRRASAFRSWPTSPHNILSYGANRRPIVVCVRSFSPLFHVLIRFFHPSTSSSTMYAKHTQHIIILLYMCRTHKSPCE